MLRSPEPLPVEAILPGLSRALAESSNAVLRAPPGSGKTTRIPPALLAEPWLAGQRILVLEPRRLAATNAASFLAAQRGEEVGDTVGYTIRMDRRCGPETRLEILTEGVLTRRLQSDPALAGTGLVIFDEFHERSLQADLALALCRDIQRGLRADLRLLIMSATLDAEPLARLLGGCPIISTEGRSYPVVVEHLAETAREQIAATTAQGIRQALDQTDGDILAFLPGRAEIRRCRELLADLAGRVDLRPLTGQLPFAEQEAAILPGPRRRVVLATNVAETSLTIEGIQTVVDSGWERRPRFDAARGMSRLETVRISRASAEQRAGRAGRLGPGRCYRLWSQGTEGGLLPAAPPEIRQADLLPLAFELAQWGVPDGSELAWLDPPPAGHMAGARRVLSLLGAVNEQGLLTPLGRKMVRYPTHPRLARLLVAAVEQGCPGLGCDLVALLEEPDLSPGRASATWLPQDTDFLPRLQLLRRSTGQRTLQVRRAAAYWRQKLKAGRESAADAVAVGRLLALAFPDRVARRRRGSSDRYLLRDGQGAVLGSSTLVRDAEWLVAVEMVDRGGAEGEIRLASSLAAAWIEETMGGEPSWLREASWEPELMKVKAREVRRLGAIVLQERPANPTPAESRSLLLDQVRRHGLDILPWRPSVRRLLSRVRFLHHHLADQGWPDWTDETLLETCDDWLGPWLEVVRPTGDPAALDLYDILMARLGWQRRKALDSLAPERLEVPSGARIRLAYPPGEAPILAVKLQEVFGLAATPRLADGRVPVQVHLLSPAGRPLAVTSDLASFWDQVYPEVRREMKGRYPKHPWPEDPWRAEATGRTKRSGGQ